MQDPSTYTEAFEREHGCTPGDWRAWLPEAIGAHPWSAPGPECARIEIGAGTLELQWRELPPRRIALMVMPRLLVSYRFANVGADQRVRFMQRFDLVLQRGGG